MRTHYEVFGVATTATQDEIKRQFRKLAHLHHPDKGGDEAQFKEITASYAVLSIPEKRRTYDFQMGISVYKAPAVPNYYDPRTGSASSDFWGDIARRKQGWDWAHDFMKDQDKAYSDLQKRMDEMYDNIMKQQYSMYTDATGDPVHIKQKKPPQA